MKLESPQYVLKFKFVSQSGGWSWRRQWHPIPVLLPEIIPWTEEPGKLRSVGSLESRVTDTTERLHFPLSCIGERNGNPLQCSGLENPRDRGAWWAVGYGVRLWVLSE